MAHIQVSHGLDIPIKGKAQGQLQDLQPSAHIALDLSVFDDIKLRLLVKEGQAVEIGQALAEDKLCPQRKFTSPAGGKVFQVVRGEKRRPLAIVIQRESSGTEAARVFSPPSMQTASQKELMDFCLESGIFAHIRMRPCNVLAHPQKLPSRVFVNAVNSTPFAPPVEFQVKGFEEEFAAGLEVLQKLTSSPVHLVYKKGSDFSPFTQAQGVEQHTVDGPHPCGNTSVHIHHIHPIENHHEVVWTVKAIDVVCIGYLCKHGKVHTQRVLALAGEGFSEAQRGFYRVRAGQSVASLIDQKNVSGDLRLICGDVLTGKQVRSEDFISFYDHTFTVILENYDREFLHFFRLGTSKFSATKTYFSGHVDPKASEYSFSSNQHGEERAFVDGAIYEKVMPMQIPVMHLVKAIMAKDYEFAEELGLLEVDSEDFALPTFICPCKIEMSEIVKAAQKEYAQEIIH